MYQPTKPNYSSSDMADCFLVKEREHKNPRKCLELSKKDSYQAWKDRELEQTLETMD